MAQALQIAPVDKPCPVALVILHMIHVSGRGANAAPCALTAERFQEQLRWSEIIRPDGQAVPPVPLGAFPARCLLGLVPFAPAITSQLGTPWMLAGSQWFARHGLSPPQFRAKQKPEPTTTHLCVSHWPRPLRRWPCSISTMISFLHARQYRTMFFPVVVARILGDIRFRHLGQTACSSLTVNILPCSACVCNTLTSSFS